MNDKLLPSTRSSGSYLRLTLGAGILLAAVGAGAWWMGRVTPPPATASTGELLKYASTDAFTALPLEQKRPYIKALESSLFDDPGLLESMSEEQRMVARRNIGGGSMDLRVQKYMSLKSPADKQKFLDDQIAEMQRMMVKMLARAVTGKLGSGSGARPPFGPPKGMTAEQQKSMTENRNGVQMAAQMEFFAAMSQRAAERGIPMPGPQFKK